MSSELFLCRSIFQSCLDAGQFFHILQLEDVGVKEEGDEVVDPEKVDRIADRQMTLSFDTLDNLEDLKCEIYKGWKNGIL